MIDEQYKIARKLIEDNRDKIEATAKALLEYGPLRRVLQIHCARWPRLRPRVAPT